MGTRKYTRETPDCLRLEEGSCKQRGDCEDGYLIKGDIIKKCPNYVKVYREQPTSIAHGIIRELEGLVSLHKTVRIKLEMGNPLLPDDPNYEQQKLYEPDQ